MQDKMITCTVCPLGCSISVRGEGEKIELIEGCGCKRGQVYARDEFIQPVRILTSTAKVEGASVPVVPLRSKMPVPKEKIYQCMEEIRRINVKAPVRCYDVLINNVAGTGIDIVATGDAM